MIEPTLSNKTLLTQKDLLQVAEYPFTTIRPNVGNAIFPDGRCFSLADLPGLVEGANQNVGLGYRFLRHVERTSLLLFVLDLTGFQFKAHLQWRSPLETALCLARELQLYNADLADKPAICAVNKSDLVDAEQVKTAVEQLSNLESFVGERRGDLDPNIIPDRLPRFQEVVSISAKEGHNVDFLKQRLRFWLDDIEVSRRKEEFFEADDSLKRKLRAASQEHLKSLV